MKQLQLLKGAKRTVKIKVSYERPEELRKVLEQLRPDVKCWKVSGNQEGRFRKAYIELKE